MAATQRKIEFIRNHGENNVGSVIEVGSGIADVFVNEVLAAKYVDEVDVLNTKVPFETVEVEEIAPSPATVRLVNKRTQARRKKKKGR